MIPRISKVLVAVDFSDTGTRSIPYAYSIVDPGGEVHLVHVVEFDDTPNPMYAHYSPEDFNDPQKKAEAAKTVEDKLKTLVPKAAAEKKVTTKVGVGFHPNVAEGIVEEAHSRKAAVIVLGSHGRRALAHLLLGSVSEEVMRSAHLPTLVIPKT
ncbi:MAG: universal stress protein [Deltaproteobacteria bacterium]|nr:universal stress protein [Deltaproteobacteria bacterium]